MLSVDAQPIDGNLAIDAQRQYGNHADYLDVNAVIQHGRITVDAYEKPAGLQCYIPLFNNISPVWGELALDAGTHVRASTATRINPTTGLIESLANNIPRFEKHDNLLTLLDEPLGQNLIHFSHELGNVASGGWWTDVRLTSVTANGMLAPDGTAAADGLVGDVNDNTHYIRRDYVTGIVQNDKIAFTVFAKPGDKHHVAIRLDFNDAAHVPLSSGGYYFDLSDGTVGSLIGTVDDYMIEEAANGFYRIGIVVAATHADTAEIRVQLFSAIDDTDNTFPGDAATVNTWFWGADLKGPQAYFDSYVPTSGATATRATESGYPLWDLPLGLFDAEGTCSVWVRFGYPYNTLLGTHSGVIAVADQGNSLLYNYQVGGNDYIGRTFDTTTAEGVLLDWAANIWYKLVVKWSSTTSKMRVGYDSGAGIVWGTEVAFDGSYTLGANLRLAYGLFGPIWFHKLMLLDRTLTDIEINAHHGSP